MRGKLMKRCLSLLLCAAMLCGAALAQDVVDANSQPIIHEAIEEGGDMTVVNGDASDPSAAEREAFAGTPLDVVIVIDTSGSMSAQSSAGKTLLAYATEASSNFVDVLGAVNPNSRVAIVGYASSATDMLQLTPVTEPNTIKQAINRMDFGGSTNQDDGFRHAEAILRGKRPGATGVILLLTDGEPDSDNDPVVTGTSAARDNLVYTVGLVGGMSEERKVNVRRNLNAGYEQRYFEVDFASVGDIDMYLTQAFTTIALGASFATDAGGRPRTSYRFFVDGSMDLYITNSISSSYLSTDPMDECKSTVFGSVVTAGNAMEQKIVMLAPGNYTIRLRGTRTGIGSYSLTSMTGTALREATLLKDNAVRVHPALVYTITVTGTSATIRDESWDPLDHTATDPFNGRPTRGSQATASGTLNVDKTVRAWHTSGAKLTDLKAGVNVQVLCRDPGTRALMISYVDGDGRLCRGWVDNPDNADAVENNANAQIRIHGYVPDLVCDPPVSYSVPAGATARRAPAAASAPAPSKKASGATLVHAEYDFTGREWVYLLLDGDRDRAAVYVPADEIAGWQDVAPRDFRIGYETPVFMWQLVLGKNKVTKVMWVASQTDGSGVAVSGNTQSSGGNLKAKNGGRDAFALLVTPDGEIEQKLVTGGSQFDSFHCILPLGGDYYVAGVTRSNDKAFKGVWDTATYGGKTKGKTGSGLALIGKLDGNFGVSWMKAYGNGGSTAGFDVVVPMPDGSVVGSGWMSATKNFALQTAGQQDFFLVKMSAYGQLLYMQRFGSGEQDVPDSATPTADGGLILAGSRGTQAVADGQLFVVDAGFNQVSNMTYGSGASDVFDNVRDMGDGTYLVTGFTGSYGRGARDFWVMRVDGMGRMIQQWTYGGTGDEELCGTTLLPDGRIVLVGTTVSWDGDVLGTTYSGTNGWAVCLNEDGRILWQYTAALGQNCSFVSAALDPQDGGIVLGGVCQSKGDSESRGWLVKLMIPGR